LLLDVLQLVSSWIEEEKSNLTKQIFHLKNWEDQQRANAYESRWSSTSREQRAFLRPACHALPGSCAQCKRSWTNQRYTFCGENLFVRVIMKEKGTNCLVLTRSQSQASQEWRRSEELRSSVTCPSWSRVTRHGWWWLRP
jgi:hypothetical protein